MISLPCWHNGKLYLPPQLPALHPNQGGVDWGVGLFETLWVNDKKAAFFPQHFQRLSQSARSLGLPHPPYEEVYSALSTLLNTSTVPRSPLRLRLSLRAHHGDFLTTSSTLLTLQLNPLSLDHSPLSLTFSPFCLHSKRPTAKYKTLSYDHFIYAARDAWKKGFDEALLSNEHGYISETSRANFFAISQGILLTPPLSDGPLPGITRATILELAKRLSIPYKEHSLSPSAIQNCEGFFLTNALWGIRPAFFQTPPPQAHPLISTLQAAFLKERTRSMEAI